MPLLCLLTLAAPGEITVDTPVARLVIGADGAAQLLDAATGEPVTPALPLLVIDRDGAPQPATAAAREGDSVAFGFGESGVRVRVRITPHERHFALEVEAVEGDGVTRLNLLDLPVLPGAPLAACALARNALTNVPALPQAQERLAAYAEARFGLVGASVALVACPPEALREGLQEAVSAAPELPHSPLGGPWALDSPLNRSSYLFNFDGIRLEQVDGWIERLASLGFNQVQMHGGTLFRFGDCRLDPNVYPNGTADLKAVIDRFHAAGILVGMQPYAFFISEQAEWVTPVPDPRLASDAEFTLAEPVDAAADRLPVLESTADLSLITSFFTRNSVTLRIDDELIVYAGRSEEPPYAFTQCQRGALGTTAAPHAAGARAYHLKECFGLFVPDPATTLFAEVAARQAELFNAAGFDTIYLDALDGEDILGGADATWHYGTRWVYELWRQLERPAVMEMSTFRHHLWCVRSRMGAWDHPTRGHQRFIDLHVAGNAANERMFLPSNLGWWAFKTWSGQPGEPTFPEDIEYLCAKAIGTGSGLSMTTYDPAAPGQQRLAAIVREHEALRHAGTVPESIRSRLREPGAAFTLVDGRFAPAHYVKQTGRGGMSWRVDNPFAAQPPRIRIEALLEPGDDEAAGAVPLIDFAAGSFATRHPHEGITAELAPSDAELDGRRAAARLTATSTRPEPVGAWVRLEHRFDPPRDLSATPALGLWVHGDGSGALLNVQLQSPDHLSHGAIREHYVELDFTGWRYVELVEPDSARWPDLRWPYGWSYAIFREQVRPEAIDRLSLWLNNLPANQPVELYLSAIRALPLGETAVVEPSLTIGGEVVRYALEIPTGAYLEHRPGEPARLFGQQGEPLGETTPTTTPTLPAGPSELRFDGTGRARVTIGMVGEPMDE